MSHDLFSPRSVWFGPQPVPGARRAFTMVEAIIVIVLVGILASVSAVRFTDSLDRRVEVSLRHLEAVLGSLAHRQTVSQSQLALVVDGDPRTDERVCIRLEVLNQWSEEDEPVWEPDVMSRPAWFDQEIKLTHVYVDSYEVEGPFRMAIPHGEPRPTISIEIAYGERGQIVELVPHDLKPHRLILSSDAQPDSAWLLPVDLDDEGMAEEAWDW
ncbi:MAG: type II secretion system protein [Planctomycetes bacterium]|nr:type II secretion system protein [Planctomycetota bacterium]NOG55770.1 type II secretion system protein [Planctomycetota bacterium]